MRGKASPTAEVKDLIVHVFIGRTLKLIWIDDKGREVLVEDRDVHDSVDSAATIERLGKELADWRVRAEIAEAAIYDIQNRLATCVFKQTEPT